MNKDLINRINQFNQIKYKDMADMLDNIGDYIGKNATFTYFERTKAGSYRHPQFKCVRDYE